MTDVQVVGVLVMVDDDAGNQTVQLVSPDHMYITMPPAATPDAWLPVVSQLGQTPHTTVLGLLADGGAM